MIVMKSTLPFWGMNKGIQVGEQDGGRQKAKNVLRWYIKSMKQKWLQITRKHKWSKIGER